MEAVQGLEELVLAQPLVHLPNFDFFVIGAADNERRVLGEAKGVYKVRMAPKGLVLLVVVSFLY